MKLLLVRSEHVQIYPLLGHRCGGPTGTVSVVRTQPCFLDAIGNVLAWSCSHCDYALILDCQTLTAESARTMKRGEPDEQPQFMGTEQWARRTGCYMTRSLLYKLVQPK